jgi:hypothetical protein
MCRRAGFLKTNMPEYLLASIFTVDKCATEEKP